MGHGVGAGGKAPAVQPRSRLLVVDDDVISLRSLERTLRDEGFEVRAAQSIEEARWLIVEHEFDAALIDLGLDESQGPPLVARLRTVARPCCAVVLTGMTRVAAARHALAAGAEGFLIKPVQPEELFEAMRRTADRTH